MAEVLVVGKKISEMELVTDISGNEKIPTGVVGDKAVTTGQLVEYLNSNGRSVWGRIDGDISDQIDLQNQFTQEREALKSYTQDQASQQQEALQTHINKTNEDFDYILKNGAALPYDESIEYVEGAPVLKNGLIQYKVGSGFKSRDSVTIPTYSNAADGVDTVTGVADGAYFNVRPEDDSDVLEYQNIGGVPTLSGKSYPSSATVAAVSEDVGLVKTKVSREFISVWDFFTKAEIQAYNLAMTNGTFATFDCSGQLKKFFDYISANDVGTAYCSGTFYTSKGILFGGTGGSKTKKILGEFNLCAIAGNPIHTLFTMQTGSQFAWLGRVHVQGIGGIWYGQRTVQVGLLIGGQYSARDTYITQVDASGGFKEFGVVLGNNTTGSHLDSIRTTRCGSGLHQAGYSLTTSFNLVSEVLSGGPSQRSVLNCSQLPPTASTDIQPMLYIDGNLHIVYSIDATTNEVTVFPIISRGITTGEARWVFGAGLATSGGDASVSRIGKLTGTANGVTYASGALYPVQMGALTSEANFIGATLGRSPSSAHVGGSIQSFYCENQTFDLVRRTRAQLNVTISSEYAMNLDKFFDLTAARSTTTGNISWETGAYFEGVFLVYRGYPISFCGRPAGVNEGSVLTTNPASDRTVVQYRSSYTFTLTTPNDSLSRAFGRTSTSCIVINPNASDGAPTGAVTFNAPSGYTVNKQSSVSFSGFTSAARFEVYWIGGTDIVVVPLTLIQSQTNPSASITYDPPSIAANATIETTVTLTGVVVGDIVQAAFSQYDAGIEISAVVSATNTVAVRFRNTSAAPIDLASGTLTVKVI